MSEPTTDQVIAAYLACRQRKADLEKKHKEEIKPFNEKLARAEAWLLARMQADEITNVGGTVGTAYIKKATSCTVADWDAFLAFIVDNQAWYMLTQAASKAAVEGYTSEVGELPPGINWRSESVVQVRKK